MFDNKRKIWYHLIKNKWNLIPLLKGGYRMEHISIALISDDRAYGKALGLGLLHVCRSFLIRLFTPQQFLQNGRKDAFDLVLWDGELPEIETEERERLIQLVEKPSMMRKDFHKKEFCLYRYNCAQAFVADLFELYGKLTGRHPVNVMRQDIRLFAFVSCEGGAGCSTAAVSVGRELCRYHQKRVLYLSLEEVESTENFFSSYSGAKSMGRYLYHLFRSGTGEKDATQLPFLDGYVIRDEFGLETFAPTRGRNPLRELNSEEFFLFLESLMQSGRYDIILLDVGGALSPLDLACIELAEKICMIAAAQGSAFREAQYMQYLICRCSEAVTEKFVKVANRMAEEELLKRNSKGIPKGGEDPILSCRFALGKSRYFSDEKKGKRLAEEGSFQNGIAALTEFLTEPLT